MPKSHDTDPLAGFTTPPLGETSAQASAREEREACAKRVSDEIDEGLRLQRVALKKEKSVVKVYVSFAATTYQIWIIYFLGYF